MRKEIQLRFDNIVSKPALLCVRECWTICQRDKFQNKQMRFLRSLSAVTLRDRIKIRKKLKVEEITDDIQNYQLKWNHMFLGCQKIDHHANHCNMDSKEKGI